MAHDVYVRTRTSLANGEELGRTWALRTLPNEPTHLVDLPPLLGGAPRTSCSGPLAEGMTQVEVRVAEAAVSVDVVQALPHHLLLLQKALVGDQ